MNSKFKAIILVLFFTAAGVIIALKNQSKKEITENNIPKQTVSTQLPKLLDLGSHSCVPCKMMMPVLDTLRDVHSGKLDVEFIDIWQNREAGEQYGIRAIPTQIIYDADGKELFRHEGFWSREDIESKLNELGISLGEKS